MSMTTVGDNNSMPDQNDWSAQEEYLLGATILRKPYRAVGDTPKHDHCEFCLKEFMYPGSREDLASFIASHPEIVTEGYAVQGGTTAHGIEDDYWWICPDCVHDFRDRFRWIVLETPAGG